MQIWQVFLQWMVTLVTFQYHRQLKKLKSVPTTQKLKQSIVMFD